MKQVSTLLLLVSLVGFAFAQSKEIYTSDDFAQRAASHKSIAVLPFKVTLTLRPKEMQAMSPQALADRQKADGETVQRVLYTYLLERKESKQMSLDIKDQAYTNAILAQNNVTQETISNYTPKQLAEMLGVDAIMMGKVNTSKPMSDGASVALALVVGFAGSTNKGNTTIEIYDGASGELLWSYFKELSRSLGSDTQTIYKTLMRKATKTIPYIQES